MLLCIFASLFFVDECSLHEPKSFPSISSLIYDNILVLYTFLLRLSGTNLYSK